MSTLNRNSIQPQLKTASVCGLFCSSCSLYIGTVEEPARLEFHSQQFGKPVEDMQCSGCRTDNLSFYCKTCKMKKCSAERGISFCSECEDYPCPELEAFQQEAPHRAELWTSLEQIKTEGWEKWFSDMLNLHSCGDCGTINSPYDSACRTCGGIPASRFSGKHNALIAEHKAKLKRN